MKTLLYGLLLVSLCAVVSFCAKAVNFEENEVNFSVNSEANQAKKKAEKIKQNLSSGLYQIAERQRLINYIFSGGYDKRNYPTNMTVQLGLALLKIDIDERKSTFEADVWLKMMWSDKRLAWDKSEFDVDVLRMSSGEIWRPDTTLYNSATLFEMMKCSEANTLIYPNGDVLWVPPCHLSAHCNLTLNTNPYGPQKCPLKFGSWTFDGLSMDLQIYNNETKADATELWDTTQWSLISNDFKREVKYYDCCPEPYVSLTFNVGIQRKSSLSKTVSCDS